MRGTGFARQLMLLQLLETRASGVEVDEAARELGMQRRTVYRDFEVLQQSGVPLKAERDGKRARWRIQEGYRHRLQLSLTWSEVLALSTGAELMKGLSGTLFHEGALSALEKIRATLPRGLAQRVRDAEEGMGAAGGGRDYSARASVLQRLIEAISGKETVVARYRSRGAAGGGTQRRLDPYHLRVSDGGIYLIAYCHRSREVRTFLLDRFDSVELTEEAFRPVSDFRPEQYLAQSFGMWSSGRPRKIRFVAAPAVAHLFLERKVHPSQIAQRRADGSVEVSLEVAVGPPLLAFLAGHGAELTRLQPADVARQVRAIHEKALDAVRPKRGAARARPERRKPRVTRGDTRA